MKKPLNLFLLAGLLAGSVTAGMIMGYGRLLLWFFLPGIQGMLFGGLIGFVGGAVLAARGVQPEAFRIRLFLVGTMLVGFYGGQALIPAFVLDGWDPLFLPAAILDGHFREGMTGASVRSFTVQQGPLTPAWWVFFQGLDTLFFAFFALLFLGIGLGRRRGTWGILRPLMIVGVPGFLILVNTVDEQRFNAGLLRDWHLSYGGGLEYLDWRRDWADTGLRGEAVRAFLAESDGAPIGRMPGLGALRALGCIRMGDPEAALVELDRGLAALESHPGPVRLDLVRRVSVSALEEHLRRMRQAVGELSRREAGDPVAGTPDLTGEWFPYESVLLGEPLRREALPE